MSDGERRRGIALGTAASFTSRIATIAVNLALVPILFHGLGREELGVWLLCGQATGFLALLDFGLQPTIARRIALATGRAAGAEGEPSAAQLVAMARWTCRLLALLILALGLAAGWPLLALLHLGSLPPRDAMTAWALMCAAHAVTVWGGAWSSVLQGYGRIGLDIGVSVAAGIATSAAQAALVLTGHGVIALAAAALAVAVMARVVARIVAARIAGEACRERPRWDRALAARIAAPSVRAWITALGTFLILKTDQFFIAAYLSPAEIPPYYAAYQVVANLYAFAGSFAVASSAFVGRAWGEGDTAAARAIVSRNVRAASILMGCGAACLMVTGESLITAWIGRGEFVGYPVLGVFCAMLTLQAHHKSFEYGVRATGDEAFAGWYVAAGALNLVLTWLLVTRLGLLGVALGTLLAQASTLNWFAVARGLRVFSIGLARHLRATVAPAAIASACAYAAAYAAAWHLPAGQADLARLAAASAGAGLVLAVAIALHLTRAATRTVP
jgi:O-antigen/teichoic acid export membrane protein